ncbi:hypothetical protein [Bradyrhizobium aeschynomenes]|uniref:hypothetical protein n=1 Tax=Bradyrhizobium aeschynomenes TaxID=2734909 RepID=UPI001FEFDF1F|nr:hypothetical protein [Bradyrhizobium aeschynomenes]
MSHQVSHLRRKQGPLNPRFNQQTEHRQQLPDLVFDVEQIALERPPVTEQRP